MYRAARERTHAEKRSLSATGGSGAPCAKQARLDARAVQLSARAGALDH
jgi:hypothetical protein